MEMGLPDPVQNFIHPTPGGEEGQSAALAAGAARDGVAQSPPATLDPTWIHSDVVVMRRGVDKLGSRIMKVSSASYSFRID